MKLSAHSFHSTAPTKAAEDTPAIDYVLMPQYELVPQSPPEVLRIPLLPTTFSPSRSGRAHMETVESVIRPEISTVSADSTHIASPSAMSEVTDNHAIELDPYDLTAKVTAAAKKMGELPVEKLKEVSVVKELWTGLLDDLMGGSDVLTEFAQDESTNDLAWLEIRAAVGALEMAFFYSSSRMDRTTVSPWLEEISFKLNDAAPVEIVEGVTGSVAVEVLAGPEVAPSGIGMVRLVDIRAVAVGETEFEVAIMLLLLTPKPTILFPMDVTPYDLRI
ncbi:hypothetical protein G7Y79_00048g084330 [Physcia stellaris]|nr:hypothetical protein G7Y79_00048g084330 [Physcia stellaris]